MELQTFEGLMIPPALLMADSNIRFGLKKYRVEDLANSIEELGGVQSPLKVTKLADEGPNGEQYRVREGHYRHAALMLLHKKGKEYEAPCIVEEEGAEDGLDRLKLQLAENNQREDLSPMDKAVAIRKLITLGVPKVEIRALFAKPSGRKSIGLVPLSNSAVNIMDRFNDFPKDIQNRIHDGRLNFEAAYKLGLKPADKWEAILAQAEKDRLDSLDQEEKDDKSLEESLRKEEAREAQAKAEAEALAKAQELAAKAEADAKAAIDTAQVKYKAVSSIPITQKDERAKAAEELKAAEAARKLAEKVALDAKNMAAKLEEKASKQRAEAAERKKKLEAARASKPITAPEVEKAAQKVDAGGPIALKPGEIREALREMTLPGSYTKVKAIGGALLRCVNGAITPVQMIAEVAYITGENTKRPKHLAKEEKVAKAS